MILDIRRSNYLLHKEILPFQMLLPLPLGNEKKDTSEGNLKTLLLRKE
jgi:hypothetical protein